MSIIRLALGLAAATAIAVMFANRRQQYGSSGSADDLDHIGMGSTPGTDRWRGGSDVGLRTASSVSGLGGQAMSGIRSDEALSPSVTGSK